MSIVLINLGINSSTHVLAEHISLICWISLNRIQCLNQVLNLEQYEIKMRKITLGQSNKQRNLKTQKY